MSLVTDALHLAYRGQQRSLHGAAAAVQRLTRRVALGDDRMPSRAQQRDLRRSFERLLERDQANVEAGVYPRSLLFQIPYITYARALPRLVRDLPNVVRRMRRADYKDLPRDVDLERYPPYYRRTFHWQSDGYLSRRSAELYDVGVEFLFGGTADVMRRQIIPPLVAHARTCPRPLRVLEVACGTGRAGEQLLRALPDADYTGVDLSPYYLDVARERLGRRGRVALVPANAEALPLPDASFDAVCSVYLFHELPRNARRRVFAEMYRVLRPGGCLVIEDSIQSNDTGGLDTFMARFSAEMHEPFYREYLGDELGCALAEAGFEVDGNERMFLSKVVSARRPASPTGAE
ncbi:class I SAM-dependent methyltransferase [Paraliomyxa miuraensis]|uniref:class I SAM-dependent methyltransferase n=1 Tax=Paraliomyxa miuraensis TaxID=376150 RepID=UPI00224EED62|nr:class I SAM-dependent methyltransferase [Paraliomyxa miuraensis]MCX4246942.1 RNA methyltransferase [Paraliomyxa miuraensis]